MIMGMPVIIEIVDITAKDEDIEEIFSDFRKIDERFSPYKETSEVMLINRGKLARGDYSQEMNKIIALAEETKHATNGFFTTTIRGLFDPSGIVKGYAIWEAAKKLEKRGYENFFVEIGGDIQIKGVSSSGSKWVVGIRNPFQTDEIIKVLSLTNCGIATSGTYLRGSHIYNPVSGVNATDIASITVIGKNVYEADRFATAAFAMGENGISFIQSKQYLEAYMITNNERAYFTEGFSKFVQM